VEISNLSHKTKKKPRLLTHRVKFVKTSMEMTGQRMRDVTITRMRNPKRSQNSTSPQLHLAHLNIHSYSLLKVKQTNIALLIQRLNRKDKIAI
jgi:hypothetical protein